MLVQKIRVELRGGYIQGSGPLGEYFFTSCYVGPEKQAHPKGLGLREEELSAEK